MQLFFFFPADLSSISALPFNENLLNFNMQRSKAQRAIKGVFVHRLNSEIQERLQIR